MGDRASRNKEIVQCLKDGGTRNIKNHGRMGDAALVGTVETERA